MKICPICEQKIEGRFCTHCFRFVTPWNVGDHTYINKSHDAGRDKDCDYHNPKTQYSRQEYMQPGYEKRIYGGGGSGNTKKQTQPVRQNRPAQAARQTQKSSSGVNTPGSAKPSRVALIIVIAILVFGVIPVVISFLDDNYHDIWSRDDTNLPAYSTEPAASEPETPSDDSRSIKGYLSAISYVDKEESYLGTYYYYNPDDITGLTEYHCDNGHFDLTVDEFYDRFVQYYGEEPLTIEEVSDEDNNYLLDSTAGEDYILLETEYDWEYETFDVEVYADTASGELHGYSFIADEADDAFYEMIYRWCNEEFPGKFASVEDLKDRLSSSGGYLSESVDDIRLKIFQMSGYVSMDILK